MSENERKPNIEQQLNDRKKRLGLVSAGDEKYTSSDLKGNVSAEDNVSRSNDGGPDEEGRVSRRWMFKKAGAFIGGIVVGVLLIPHVEWELTKP